MDLSSVGRSTLNAGKAAFNIGKNVTTGVGKTAAGVATGFALPMIGGAMVSGENVLGFKTGKYTPGGGYASKIVGLGNKLIDYNPDVHNNLSGSKVSGWGITAFAATSAIDGTIKAYRNYNQRRMGTIDNHITRATPQVPTYDLNAGATGDLVFAMNANRRG